MVAAVGEKIVRKCGQTGRAYEQGVCGERELHLTVS